MSLIVHLSFSQSFSIAQIGRELRDVPPGKGGTFVKSIRPKAVIANNYEFGFDSYPNHFVHLTGSLFLSTSQFRGTTGFSRWNLQSL